MKKPLFLVFDNETTGLTKHRASPVSVQPRIIEIAGILTDGINILETFEELINPGVVLEEIITKITGLTNDMLDDKPSFFEFLPKLPEMFSKADFIIAHNMSFDRSVLKYELERCDKTLEDVGFTGVPVCTVEEMYPSLGYRIRMADLYERLVGPYVQKHRALDDIKLLHTICQKIGLYKALGGLS